MCKLVWSFLVLSLEGLAHFHWLVDVAKQRGCSIYVLLTYVSYSFVVVS